MSDEKETPNEELSEEQKKEKAGKDEKKFQDALAFVAVVVDGEKNLRPKKKQGSDLTARVVAKLFKEQEEKLFQEVQDGLRGSLSAYLEMEKQVAAKQKELDELHKKKKKEFVESVNKWRQKIEENEVRTQGYKDALKVAGEALSENK